MTAVFTGPDAQVIGAVLVLVGTLAALFVQNRKTHRDNRADHAETAAKVDRLLEAQGEIRDDVREIKNDLGDVKADVRAHSERLRLLEAPAPKPTPRKKAAS